MPEADTRSGRGRGPLLAVLTGGIALLLALAASELLLRLAGRRPWSASRLDRNEPVMNEPDPVLGWWNRPGRYVVPPYAPGSSEVTLRFGPEHDRATGSPGRARGVLLLVGGSYVRGNAVSDEETFAWKLQRRFPALRVRNYGVGGYGTCQSLLLLERVLPRNQGPGLVLYGFIDHHETRNVAPAAWQDLLSRFSRRRQVAVPYCTLDDAGRLRRHPPERYPHWPLRERLATVNLVQRLYADWRARGRDATAREVTEAAILAMRESAAAAGKELAVVLLAAKPDARAHYRRFLATRDVAVSDCVHPLRRELRVPREGHPNGRMHTIWAECIAESLHEPLSRAAGQEPAASR